MQHFNVGGGDTFPNQMQQQQMPQKKIIVVPVHTPEHKKDYTDLLIGGILAPIIVGLVLWSFKGRK